MLIADKDEDLILDTTISTLYNVLSEFGQN